MLKLSNSLLHYKGEDDDDDELLEKQMSKISVSKIPTKDSIL